MTKLEQVIKALQLCRYDPDPGQECKFLVSCDICPYWKDEVGCREIDLFNDALELLKERQWVNVKDKQPESGRRYLVYATKADGTDPLEAITAYCGGIFPLFGKWAEYKVFHWMPLPEPPKEGESE